MEKRLYKAFGIVVIICIAFLYALGMEAWERKAKAEAMDSRELHYDADGGFILIDTQIKLMGVYDADKPLKHLWLDDIAYVDPGLYRLSICDGWIELMDKHEYVTVIYLREKDTDFLREKVEQGIPVLAY